MASEMIEDTASDNTEQSDRYNSESDISEHQTIIDRGITILKNDWLILMAFIIVISFLLIAVLAPYLSPYNPEESFSALLPPLTSSESAFHLLGTDSRGQDILSQIIHGARISLLVAGATALISFTIGTTIGLLAGYYGGWIDNLLMRYIDFQWAFPALILAIGIIAVLGEVGVINVIVAISIAYIDDFARIVRGEVLSIREKEYIDSARVIGMSDRRIMFREVLPNAVAPMIVQLTLMIPLAILSEASLSFLGLGVQVTTPSWGMLLGRGRDFITTAWWISIMPGLAIMVVVLSFNVVGDGLRDMFDISEGQEGR